MRIEARQSGKGTGRTLQSDPALIVQRVPVATVASFPKLTWRVRELAAAVGLSIAFIHQEIRAGRLPAYKLETATLIKNDDALAWLDARLRRLQSGDGAA
ncbi:MAG: hypothetical protein ACO24O_07185 [Arenimonas sp.]